MKSTPQQFTLFLLVAALLVLVASACQTSRGFGQDVEKLGEKIQEKSKGPPGGPVLRRYVPGPGMDEPVVWYEGSGTADRR